MEIIYVVEDINDLKYVGRTKRTIDERHQEHKYSKYNNCKKCSSHKLHLENSIISQLEICEEDIAKERECYWINKLDTVNENNRFEGTNKEYQKKYKKEWTKNNKEKIKIISKKWYENNKEHIKARDSQRWFCETCKCEVRRGDKSKHLKTNKHLSQIQQQQDTQESPDES